MKPTVVIVGAGVVGAALAHRLTSRGWVITLIDQYPRGTCALRRVDARG